MPELKEGANPFYVTSYQRGVGLSLIAELKCGAVQMDYKGRERKEETNDLSFLFSRSSDSIGAGIPYSDSALSKVFRQKDSLTDAVNRKSFNADLVQNEDSRTLNRQQFNQEAVQEILMNYNHEPVVHHPLYTISSNEYGRNKPTPATFTSSRMSRNQAFSTSFNKIMPKGNGLNTSLSRSKVHSLLDPRFL